MDSYVMEILKYYGQCFSVKLMCKKSQFQSKADCISCILSNIVHANCINGYIVYI